MTEPVGVGIVGCGNISSIYLENCTQFPSLRVVACADLLLERAQAQAQKYGVPRACSVEELLADPEIELVINLTVPQAHAALALDALRAGKSVYNEKPLALTREDAREMLALAQERGLLVGCAPDTFLGAGLQTCRTLIDAGAIGDPVAVHAFMHSRGPERWHPNPEFFYQVGAGPLFDMGPYYLTALVSLIGPVRRVTSSARISFAERLITSQPLHGTRITVNTPTHIAAVLDFANGAVATLVTSFDIHPDRRFGIDLYGTDGTLIAPDPNTFGGPVRLFRASADAWQEPPLNHHHAENSRGIGVADMALALRTGSPQRAQGALAYHVLDVMHAILEASQSERHIAIESTCERPAALAPQWSALEEHV